MMAATGSSAEPQSLLVTYNAKLVDAIEPSPVAASLYSGSFISSNLKSRVCEMGSGLSKRDKSGLLVSAIEDYIKSCGDDKRSNKFSELLSILKRHVPVNIVAESMEKEWRSAGFSTAGMPGMGMKLLFIAHCFLHNSSIV